MVIKTKSIVAKYDWLLILSPDIKHFSWYYYNVHKAMNVLWMNVHIEKYVTQWNEEL